MSPPPPQWKDRPFAGRLGGGIIIRALFWTKKISFICFSVTMGGVQSKGRHLRPVAMTGTATASQELFLVGQPHSISHCITIFSNSRFDKYFLD